MARSLKTLNPLAGYLVWSGSAWGGVGEAPDTRQAVCVTLRGTWKGRGLTGRGQILNPEAQGGSYHF